MEPNRRYTQTERKQLISRLETLGSRRLYIKVFHVIHSNDIPYSTNDNGVFFDLTTVPDNVIDDIMALVLQYEKKKSATIDFSESVTSSDFNAC